MKNHWGKKCHHCLKHGRIAGQDYLPCRIHFPCNWNHWGRKFRHCLPQETFAVLTQALAAENLMPGQK